MNFGWSLFVAFLFWFFLVKKGNLHAAQRDAKSAWDKLTRRLLPKVAEVGKFIFAKENRVKVIVVLAIIVTAYAYLLHPVLFPSDVVWTPGINLDKDACGNTVVVGVVGWDSTGVMHTEDSLHADGATHVFDPREDAGEVFTLHRPESLPGCILVLPPLNVSGE